MFSINADAVLVSIVADAVFLDPASIKVLLPQPLWLINPSFWQLASFDGFVLRPRVSLFGNRDQCGINDLPATGLQSLGAQVLLKLFKKLTDDTRLAEPFSEESNGGGIGNGVHHSQTDKLLK